MSTETDVWKGRLFAILGILLLVGGAALTADTLHFIHSASVADGVVTRVNHGPAHVQVDFTTSTGEKISYPQGGGISHQVGDAVKVLYDASEPKLTHTLDEPGALWFSSGIVFLLGFTFVLVGGGLVRGARKP